MTRVRMVPSEDMPASTLAALRSLLDSAWTGEERFTDEDWAHTIGGVHFLVEEDGLILSHASVVERTLHTSGFDLATGYVEGVATAAAHRGRGLGTAVMRAAGEHLDRSFELGALGSDLYSFYGRLGWEVWKGETSVRTEHGVERTPEDDGLVLIRLTPRTPELDLAAPISCDERPGDVW